MYKINPMSEEEIDASGLLEDGTYDFEVIKSTHKVSKSGNPMAELQLSLWGDDTRHVVYDYLVFSAVPLNIRKVKHFCDATGLQKEYEKGEIPEELEGKSGKLILGKQEGRDKPDGGKYPDRNSVVDYIARQSGDKPKKDDIPFSDDVPF